MNVFLLLMSVAVASVLSCGPVRAEAVDAHNAQTRFGMANTSNNVLTINERKINPEVSGDSDMLVDKVAENGDADYLLLSIHYGSICPAEFKIVRVTGTSVTLTPTFGNCNSKPARTVVPGKSIILSFPAFEPFLSTGAAPETDVYNLSSGSLSRLGQ